MTRRSPLEASLAVAVVLIIAIDGVIVFRASRGAPTAPVSVPTSVARVYPSPPIVTIPELAGDPGTTTDRDPGEKHEGAPKDKPQHQQGANPTTTAPSTSTGSTSSSGGSSTGTTSGDSTPSGDSSPSPPPPEPAPGPGGGGPGGSGGGSGGGTTGGGGGGGG